MKKIGHIVAVKSRYKNNIVFARTTRPAVCEQPSKQHGIDKSDDRNVSTEIEFFGKLIFYNM